MGLTLYSNAELMHMNQDANARAENEHRRARVRNLTLRGAVTEAGETVRDVLYDINGNTRRPSLRQLLFDDNRARGLGVILATLAAVFLLVDTVML